MKNIKKLLTVTAISSATTWAAPFMAVGDNAELFLTGSVAVRFDDNIFLTGTNQQSDTVLSFTPGFELAFGKGSATQGSVYFREEIVRYSDNDNQDTSLSHFGFNSQYDNGKTKVGFLANFDQIAANQPGTTPALGTIAQRDVTTVKANTEFAFSEKTKFGTGIGYDKTDYAPASFTDSKAFTVPLDVYYEMSPKLDMSAGYRYRDTDLTGAGRDEKTHFLNVGARGEFTPKMTGQIRIGYNKRSFDNGGDQTGLGVDTRLSYAMTEKTNLSFGVDNDFSNSGGGEATKVLNRTVGLQSALSEQWNFSANLGLRTVEYANRDEDFFTGLFNVSYVYSTYLNFAASYSYQNNDSTAAGGDFKDNTFSFAANVRY